MCSCPCFYYFLIISLGLLVLILGNFIIRSCFIGLRNKYIIKGARIKDTGEIPSYYRASNLLGFLESLAYALVYCLGHVGFIGVWLGVKSIGRWTSGAPASAVEYFDISDEQKRERMNAEVNIYLIGNLLSVFLGVTVGMIWKVLIN